jgi:hypothetical protein
MMKTLTLTLPLSAFEGLTAAAESQAKKCTVDREHLKQLLVDHSNVIAHLNSSGIPTADPDEDHIETLPKGKRRTRNKLKNNDVIPW